MHKERQIDCNTIIFHDPFCNCLDATKVVAKVIRKQPGMRESQLRLRERAQGVGEREDQSL